MINYKNLNLELPEEVYKKIDALANRDERSFNEEVTHILLNYITHVEERNGTIKIY